MNHQEPIRKDNLLNKLSFVVTGESLSHRSDDLKEFLLRYIRFRGDTTVSAQGVRNWFTKKSHPSKKNAYIFIHDVIDNSVLYDKLSDDQKKVYNQLKVFLADVTSSENNSKFDRSNLDKISSGTAGSLILKHNSTKSDIDRLLNSWEGMYTSYRRRLTKDSTNPVSREAFWIYRRNQEIRFKHWHLKEGVSLSFFEGNVCITDETIWFFGYSEQKMRFRICHFKMNDTLNPIYQKFRWGLMHSDIPLQSSREPVSTRILLVKESSEVKNLQNYVENTVKYISIDNIPENIRKMVSRCTDNNLPSISNAMTFEPAPVEENILSVNQSTIDVVCQTWDEEQSL